MKTWDEEEFKRREGLELQLGLVRSVLDEGVDLFAALDVERKVYPNESDDEFENRIYGQALEAVAISVTRLAIGAESPDVRGDALELLSRLRIRRANREET